MKINDKIVVAFLISTGLFSSAHAMQYVGSMSVKEKCALVSMAKSAAGDTVQPSNGADIPGVNSQNR